MNTNKRKFLLLVYIIVGMLPNTIIAQQNTKECQAQTSLSIEGIVNIEIDDPGQGLIMPPLLYGVPSIAQDGIRIKIETNQPSAALYIETDSKNGNLTNGDSEIITSYMLTGKKRYQPTSLDPRWKRGRDCRRLIQKIEGPGTHEWTIHVRAFADSSCSYGTYRDALNVVVLDSRGKKHAKRVGIQTELNENSVTGRLKSDKYSPQIAENVRPNQDIQFQFNGNELDLTFENTGDKKQHIGYIPLSLSVSADRTPCSMLIESGHARNAFLDQYNHLLETHYVLANQDVILDEISPDQWEQSIRLRTFMQRLTKAGEYRWNLWVKIADHKNSSYSNTFTFIVIDAKGVRHSQTIHVSFR